MSLPINVSFALGTLANSSDAKAKPDGSLREKPDELQLMKRLRNGDTQAMTELLATYGPSLDRLVKRLCGWTPDAEDILQEVFITAWNKSGRFQGTGSLEGWLRRIAVNHCQSHLRSYVKIKRRFRSLVEIDEPTSFESDATYTGQETLSKALSQLRQEDRTVLVLYYLEKMTAKEVNDAMGLSDGALHSRLSRARKRLRVHMEVIEQNNQ